MTAFCSPICCGCHLWSSQWELLKIQNLAMFHEENEWQCATQRAREAHFSAPFWFLWPPQIWNNDLWENVTFSTSDGYIIQHLYRGTKKLEKRMAKRKDKSTSKDFRTHWNSQVDLPELWQVETTIQNQWYRYVILPCLRILILRISVRENSCNKSRTFNIKRTPF